MIVMHHLCLGPRRHPFFSRGFTTYQARVKFFALHRIKTTCSNACAAPHQFLWVSFLWTFSPSGILNALATTLHGLIHIAPSIHRLRLGLLGYLIPFVPLAFVSHCQCRPNRVLSPLVFFSISTHFTAPPEISSTPTVLQLGSFHHLSKVEPWDLTANLKSHLQTLYAQSFRITLASFILSQLLT